MKVFILHIYTYAIHHLHTNQLFGNSAGVFHTQSRICLDQYILVNKIEKMLKIEKTCIRNKTPRNCKIHVELLSQPAS